MVLRRITMARRFGLAGAIALGVLATATASPRDPSEMGAGFSAAAPDRGALTATVVRHRNRSKALYRPGEHSVAQISPTILRGADVSMEDEARPPCAAKARRRSACRAKPMRSKGLADALLEAPSPATVQILKDIGIPAIKDVPPIAILRAGHPGVDENFTAELR